MKNTQVQRTVNEIYEKESRRVLATLIRLLGDFDLAEDALHDAFAAALNQWTEDAIPSNPRAWLVSAGRFRAIDELRRRGRFDKSLADLALQLESDPAAQEDNLVQDDQLRLIFTCCHPALPPAAQVALTLREVCGLTTEEIARAFLTTPPTIAQRIVRSKSKLRSAHIPYEIPGAARLPERLNSVLRVIYLVFNEGYSASAGERAVRHELTTEALVLGRLLVELLPEPESMGLLALMLLNESRRFSRTRENGDLITLEEQDRSLWNQEQIQEGIVLVKKALSGYRAGPYSVQAAIAAIHAEAPTYKETDWEEIVGLYDLLLRLDPSPVVELNRAAAVAMKNGPAAGIALIQTILDRGELSGYHLAYAAKADLYRRLGAKEQALAAYEKALSLVRQEPERRFLLRRTEELSSPKGKLSEVEVRRCGTVSEAANGQLHE
jgi:RNA polymerase sigma-70 factor (ECF subfamily)